MELDFILSNPPFVTGKKLGGRIIHSAKKFNPHAQFSVLMPLANYKYEDLYKYVNTSKLSLTGSDVGLFGAKIPANTVIATLNDEATDTQEYKDLEWKTYKPTYINFYNKNKELLKSIKKPYHWKRAYDKSYKDFDIETDFIEVDRAFQEGSGHGTNSNAYNWNVIEKDYEDRWFKSLIYVRFKSHQGKINFGKWWYNKGPSPERKICDILAAKLGYGLNKRSQDDLSMPQIDWENIDTLQKDLWDKGDYDTAVLNLLNLTYDKEKDEIKLKEMFDFIYKLSFLRHV